MSLRVLQVTCEPEESQISFKHVLEEAALFLLKQEDLQSKVLGPMYGHDYYNE